MAKIKIVKILPEVYSQKGFGGGPFGGCLHCPCGTDGKGDACCRFGCDVDKESHDLILDNRIDVEALVGQTIEECLEGGLVEDKDFLGEGYYRSKVRPDNFCAFHVVEGKGCALAKLVIDKKLSWRMVPTICKIYPLNWDNGVLGMYPQSEGTEIEKNCDCIREENKTDKKILETQKEFIDDLFDIDG